MKYYVYVLCDPRDNTIFYVGKGKDNRINAHEAEARSGYNSYKCNKIRLIWEKGFDIKKQIVRHFPNESEAYLFEERLIRKLGIYNLTNITCGNSIDYKNRPLKEKKKIKNDLSVDEALKMFFYFPALTKKWIESGRKNASLQEANTTYTKVLGHCLVAFVNHMLPKAYEVLIKDESTKQRVINEFGFI